MIENPILQFVVVLLFGFCLGIIFYQWYIFRVGKNIAVKIIEVFGSSIGLKQVSYKDLAIIIARILEKSVEEVEIAKQSKTKER